MSLVPSGVTPKRDIDGLVARRAPPRRPDFDLQRVGEENQRIHRFPEAGSAIRPLSPETRVMVTVENEIG